MSARSAPKILSIKGKCTFFKFSKNWFINSLASFLFEMLSFLTADLFASAATPPPLNLHKPFHVEKKLYLIRFNKYIVNVLFL